MRVTISLASLACLMVVSCRSAPPPRVDMLVTLEHLEKLSADMWQDFGAKIDACFAKYPVVDEIAFVVIDPIAHFKTAIDTTRNLAERMSYVMAKADRVDAIERSYLEKALQKIKNERGATVNPRALESLIDEDVRAMIRAAFREAGREVQFMAWIKLSHQGDFLLGHFKVMDITDGVIMGEGRGQREIAGLGVSQL
jgi:hypothetical protein